MWIGAGVLGLGLATFGAGLAAGPRVDQLTIDDRDPQGLVLVARGRGLDRLRGLWVERWRSELGEAGVEVTVDPFPAAEDGLLRLPIRLVPGFDARQLPGPTIALETQALPLHYDLKLRVAYVDYTQARQTAGAEALFAELLDYMPADEHVHFDPVIAFDVRVASANDGIERSPWFDELIATDILTSSAYLYIRLEQATAHAPTWQAQLTNMYKREPLTVVACSVRASDDYTYASAIVTPVEGALDRALRARRERLGGLEIGFFDPEEVLRTLDELPAEHELRWFVPSKSSTSGYLMPCLDWRPVLEDPRVALEPNTGEHQNNLAAARQAAATEPDAWVVASIYETLLFDEDVEREAWRVLWVEGGIPHGGVYVSNAILARKRELLIAAMNALVDDYHASARPFPDFGWGLSGLRRCPPDFDVFEQRILASPNVSYCAPELVRGP